MAHQFTGISSILLTPFDEKGRIDTDSLRNLVDFQVKAGASSVVILGILGEYQKLTEAERELVTRTVVDQAAGRVPVISGASATGTDLAISYGQKALELGCSALMVAPPTNVKNLDAVLEYYRRIDAAVDLPIVVQDEPANSLVLMPPAFLARVMKEIPKAVAIKLEEPPTPFKASKTLELVPDAAILGGLGGAFFLEELNRGCVGTMTGFGFPDILVDIYNRYSSGDKAGAADVFFRYNPILRFEHQQGIGLAIRKEIYRRRGVIQSAAIRHPGVPLDKGTADELTAVLEVTGLTGK